MMPASEWVLYGTSIVASGVAVGGWIQNRRKPLVDAAQALQIDTDDKRLRKTIEQMSRETNQDRDFRIWQLEQHYDREIVPWSRRVISGFERVVNLLRIEIEKNGGIMPEIEIPILPELPEPPHG